TSSSHGLVTIDASDSSGNPLSSGLAEPAFTASALAQQASSEGDLTDTVSGVIRGDSTFDIAASGAIAAAGSVPEPSSGILLSVGGLVMIGVITRRRKNRRRGSSSRRPTPGL
ncbi:MAG TPA: PEP-CTERM sorting domain-containing protein, partial [Pirellulales bacterium]